MDDIKIAKKYLSKIANAEKRNIKFSLPFSLFKKLVKQKHCEYSGVLMTQASETNALTTDRTIERIDSSKGYIKGNVVAVCHGLNQLKGKCENKNTYLTMDMIRGMINYIDRR